MQVEYAKTGRSKCEHCKGEIKKGELRAGIEDVYAGKMFYHWYHISCFMKCHKDLVATFLEAFLPMVVGEEDAKSIVLAAELGSNDVRLLEVVHGVNIKWRASHKAEVQILSQNCFVCEH